MVVVRVFERCDTCQMSYGYDTVVGSMRRPPQPTPWWCNGRARASLGSGCTLSEVAFEGLGTRLFGRRAGVRASGRIYGTVRLYISRHIYDLTTSADILMANAVSSRPLVHAIGALDRAGESEKRRVKRRLMSTTCSEQKDLESLDMKCAQDHL